MKDEERQEKKTNLHSTGCITPQCVTDGRTLLGGIGPAKHRNAAAVLSRWRPIDK